MFVDILYFIVGDFCNWLLLFVVDGVVFEWIVFGFMFEMVVVVLKLMCN